MEFQCPICYTQHGAGLRDSEEFIKSNETCDSCKRQEGTYVCICSFPLKPICVECWAGHCSSKHTTHRRLCLYLARNINSEAELQRVMECGLRSDCAIKRIEEVSVPEVNDAIRQVTALADQWVARIQEDRDAIVEELKALEKTLREVKHTLFWLPYTPSVVPSNLFEEWTARGGNMPLKERYRLLGLRVAREDPPMLRAAVSYSLELPATLPMVDVRPPVPATSSVLRTSEVSASPSQGSSSAVFDSQCAGCKTKIRSVWNVVYKRVDLTCGHRFHSDDCFFEYIVRSDPRYQNFKCPVCEEPIHQQVIDGCFGRDGYSEKVKGYIKCIECNEHENLTKLPKCIHYVCNKHKSRTLKKGELHCSCRSNPWM